MEKYITIKDIQHFLLENGYVWKGELIEEKSATKQYYIYDYKFKKASVEDFVDNWESNQKIDFTRKWYHTRTKHPTVSLDAEIEQYAKYNDGRELDFEDVSTNAEEQVISEVMVKQFTESLSEKDRKILEMRLEGYTQEEIAEQLSYLL